MKTKILFLAMLFISLTCAAQWTRYGNTTRLKTRTDKVAIGLTSPTAKLQVVPTSNMTTMILGSYASQTYPNLAIYSSSNVSLWSIYASTGWWRIGANDSTTSFMSVKPGWIRFNYPVNIVGKTVVTGDLTVSGFIFAPSGTDVSIGDSTLGHRTGFYGNSGIGDRVLHSNTTGAANTGTGYRVLYSNTSGNQNVGDGSSALLNNTTGSFNVAIGSGTLSGNTTGYGNATVGFKGLSSNTTGYDNVAIGDSSSMLNWTGHGNIAIGSMSDYYNRTASNRLVINNKVGGADSAIIYGTMGATPALSLLQINAPLQIFRGDTTGLGSTQNLGIVVFKISDGEFYGLTGVAGTPVWKKISN